MKKWLLAAVLALAMIPGNIFAANQAASQQITIIVVAKLGVITVTLPNIVIGQAYNATLIASGGTLPYTWSVDAATVNPLPSGLTLTPGGVISGTVSALPASCVVGTPCSVKVTFDVVDSTP